MRFDSLFDIAAITMTVWGTWKFLDWFGQTCNEAGEMAARVVTKYAKWRRGKR